MKNKGSVIQKADGLLGISMAALLLLTACKKDRDTQEVVVVSGKDNVAGLMAQFRTLLGGSLNTTPGATGGYREINWDGIPAELVGKSLPPDFFNTPGANVPASRQRGLVYEPGAGEFRVSATQFIEVNNTTAGEFAAFSGDKAFANISSGNWPIKPQVPGLAVSATVRGFGVVFSDVDVPRSTYLEFFRGDKSLGRFYAPVHGSEHSFSFLGVYFKKEKVTAIRVGHQGTLSAGGKDVSDGGTADLVILDDFIYDEPVNN